MTDAVGRFSSGTMESGLDLCSQLGNAQASRRSVESHRVGRRQLFENQKRVLEARAGERASFNGGRASSTRTCSGRIQRLSRRPQVDLSGVLVSVKVPNLGLGLGHSNNLDHAVAGTNHLTYPYEGGKRPLSNLRCSFCGHPPLLNADCGLWGILSHDGRA
jgi:hypothetical protein